MLDKLTIDDFSKCLNQTFTINVADHDPLVTELIEVRGLVPPDDDALRRQPFSLIFRGPKDVLLQQGTFEIENETLGTLGMFVVTLGPDDEGVRHEVVFA